MKNKSKYLISVILIISVTAVAVLCLTGCESQSDEGRYVEELTTFYVDKLTVFDMGVEFLIDKEESYFELRPDGTMSIRVMLMKGGSKMLLGLQNAFDIDLSTFNVQSIVDQYAASLMPGFTLDDVNFSLKLLDDSLGLSFVGFDMEEEGIQELVDSLETTGRLPKNITIPDDFGVKYEGSYYIDEVKSELTGESYKTVYTGDTAPNGEPFIMMTISEKEDGTESIYLRIEFLMFELQGATLKD